MVDRRPSVLVIGAGAGGLACAIRLASAGARVTVVDPGPFPGGKISTLEVAGRRVDAGPTVLTMRWVLEDLFLGAGARVEDYLSLERAEILARHAWPDGTRLDLFADLARSAEAVQRAFGALEARAFTRFMADARRIYETVEGPFLRSERPTIAGAARRLGLRGLAAFARIDAFRTLWSALDERFTTLHLRQLFGRYATYCGASPFEAPATLALVAHVEAVGVHRVRGGMAALALALESLARRHGVDTRYGAEARRVVIGAGRAAGVELEDGARLSADAVVFSGDVSALGEGLLGAEVAHAGEPTPREERSFSAVTWALVGRASGLPLVHHNVFFSADYAAEFRDLAAGRAPAAPTVYVCAQDRADVPAEHDEERMLLVVNAPATGDEPSCWSERERERCDRAALQTLSACGLSLRPTSWIRTTPVEHAARFPGTGGALYGARPRGSTSALSRPGSATKVPRLYLAGGSTHPGAGVPMAMLSGMHAADRLIADLRSTAQFRREVISGTTSTG